MPRWDCVFMMLRSDAWIYLIGLDGVHFLIFLEKKNGKVRVMLRRIEMGMQNPLIFDIVIECSSEIRNFEDTLHSFCKKKIVNSNLFPRFR